MNAEYGRLGWILWFASMIYLIAVLGAWAYAFRVRSHYRKASRSNVQGAINEANQRYARGEITREQFLQIREDIISFPERSLRIPGEHPSPDNHSRAA